MGARGPGAGSLLGLDTGPKRVVFVGYMALWCGLRLLVFGSQRSPHAPRYNATSLLLVVCSAKLLLATGMFLRWDGSSEELVGRVREHRALLLRYALPAAAYVLYDNLTFLNLRFFDPVTYSILMQLRLVATALMWSGMLGQRIPAPQWLALGLITAGCVVKEFPNLFAAAPVAAAAATAGGISQWTVGLLLVGLQVAAGVFASVCNETLLKRQPTIPVNLQNVFMYANSIVINLAVLAVKSELTEALRPQRLAVVLLSPYVAPIAVILATIGIVTSLFLKHLDSVRKSIASAMEIFVDALAERNHPRAHNLRRLRHPHRPRNRDRDGDGVVRRVPLLPTRGGSVPTP